MPLEHEGIRQIDMDRVAQIARLRVTNAKLLAALERAQWFIHDNICAPGDVEDCMQEVCNVAHDAIEEANK